MNRDIYNRIPMQHGGSFSADSALITFGSDDPLGGSVAGVGLLCQQINWQYVQQVTRLYEVGTNLTYYVVGRTQGNAGMARVLGPRAVSYTFYEIFGDACKAPSNVLTLSANAGCGFAGSYSNGFAITLTGVLIQSLAGSVRAEDMLISEQLGLMFVALLMTQVNVVTVA